MDCYVLNQYYLCCHLFIIYASGLKILEGQLVPEINECYLLHGTKESTTNVIAHDGLDFRVGSEKAMFGIGAYCAENSTKADQYTGLKSLIRLTK